MNEKNRKTFLEMNGISKQYPGTLALDEVDFTVYSGEVLGVIGENGAGKSTLMNIISGAIDDYTGSIEIEGSKVEIRTPSDSKVHGIVTIHQELSLFPNLDIAQNIFMGNESRKTGVFIDKEDLYQKSKLILERLGLNLDLHSMVGDLTVSQRQMVEIARALSYNAKLIIMDEPTSSLSVDEIDVVEGIISRLKADGVSVIFITHKLNEIVRFTERVYVLRDGKNVETISRDEYSYDRFISGMVGKKMNDFYQKVKSDTGDVVLELSDLSTDFLNNISFHVRKGEVLGLTGPVGSGRTEIMETVVGIHKIRSGKLSIGGSIVSFNSPHDAANHGVALVPEDRKKEGLILELPVQQNIILSVLSRISIGGFIRKRVKSKIVNQSVQALNIKTPSLNNLASSLSGGNQQKVVLAKWLASDPQILLLDEPTRGIDVGAKQEIYGIINGLAEQGIAIVLASSELEEIIKMSDRILVLHEGKIRQELAAEEATQEKILAFAHT